MIDASKSTDPEVLKHTSNLEVNSPIFSKKPFVDLGERPSKPAPSIEKSPVLELKYLPSHSKYTYLGENSPSPVIVSLTPDEEEWLLRIF